MCAGISALCVCLCVYIQADFVIGCTWWFLPEVLSFIQGVDCNKPVCESVFSLRTTWCVCLHVWPRAWETWAKCVCASRWLAPCTSLTQTHCSVSITLKHLPFPDLHSIYCNCSIDYLQAWKYLCLSTFISAVYIKAAVCPFLEPSATCKLTWNCNKNINVLLLYCTWAHSLC